MTWLPFDLHPEYPAHGIPRADLIARYGPGMVARVTQFLALRGLRYNPHPDIVPNSRSALRLAELARSYGVFGPFHERLMDAYWGEARNIGDEDELRAIAAENGLASGDVDDVLASDRFLDVVESSTRAAASVGATGVPAFLLERRLLVVGAQPEETFERAFAQLAATPPAHGG